MRNDQSRFLALLRGINVGGKNVIAKDDLKSCFVNLGFRNVLTYIQSGNILFRAGETRVKTLTRTIEKELSERFSYAARAVVLSYEQYALAVEAASEDWGNDDKRRHNALFTLGDLQPEEVLAELPPRKAELETVAAGPGVIFWSASKKHLSRTTMMKLSALPVYKQLTVRNHNTVLKLRELFKEL